MVIFAVFPAILIGSLRLLQLDPRATSLHVSPSDQTLALVLVLVLVLVLALVLALVLILALVLVIGLVLVLVRSTGG